MPICIWLDPQMLDLTLISVHYLSHGPLHHYFLGEDIKHCGQVLHIWLLIGSHGSMHIHPVGKRIMRAWTRDNRTNVTGVFFEILIQVWWSEEAKHLYARQAHLARQGVWEAWHWAWRGDNPSSPHWRCRCPLVGSSCHNRPVNGVLRETGADAISDPRALPKYNNYSRSSWNVADDQNTLWLPTHRLRPVSSPGVLLVISCRRSALFF